MGGLQVFPLIDVENRPGMPQSPAMIQWHLLPILLAAVTCGSGCHKTTSLATAPEEDSALPTAAQPKLETMKLWLGAEEMVAELALTGPQMQTGMMFRTNLAESAGMLFVFPAPHRASFWM